MSEIKVNNIQSAEASHGPVISGTVEMKSTGAMSLPRGDTAYRGGRGRGVFGGGRLQPTPSAVYTNVIEYVQISTLSDALDFGDLSFDREHVGGSTVASSIRGIWAGGYGATGEDHISYVTISSTGNAFDFGDLTGNTRNFPSHSNNTRGIFGPCNRQPTGANSQIQYITIATTGNAAEFGQLGQPGIEGQGAAGVGDSTRAIFCGGYISSPNKDNGMYYVTIATLGNALDFGDIADGAVYAGSASGSGRGIIAGGRRISADRVDTIDYITVQSLGDSIDFGNLTSTRADMRGGASNGTRAIFAGGVTPSYDDTMDYIEIMTTGNAQDFGNLSVSAKYHAGLSDSHGGIS